MQKNKSVINKTLLLAFMAIFAFISSTHAQILDTFKVYDSESLYYPVTFLDGGRTGRY